MEDRDEQKVSKNKTRRLPGCFFFSSTSLFHVLIRDCTNAGNAFALNGDSAELDDIIWTNWISASMRQTNGWKFSPNFSNRRTNRTTALSILILRSISQEHLAIDRHRVHRKNLTKSSTNHQTPMVLMMTMMVVGCCRQNRIAVRNDQTPTVPHQQHYCQQQL